jgi:hypothetical protein
MKGGRSLKMNGGCIDANTLMILLGLLVICVVGYYLFTVYNSQVKVKSEKFIGPSERNSDGFPKLDIAERCRDLNPIMYFGQVSSYLTIKNKNADNMNFNVMGKDFTVEWWGKFHFFRNEKETMFFENDLIGLGKITDENAIDPSRKTGWILKFNGKKKEYIYDANPNKVPPFVDFDTAHSTWNHIALSVKVENDNPARCKVFICINGNALFRYKDTISKIPKDNLIVGRTKTNGDQEYPAYQIAQFKFLIGQALYTTKNKYTIPSKRPSTSLKYSLELCILPESNEVFDISSDKCVVEKTGLVKFGGMLYDL